MKLGVLTGLAAEARLLERALTGSDVIVARTGAVPERARGAAESLVAAGAGALLSFGLAGGLDPRLRAGDLVLADRVVLPDGRSIPTTPAWHEAAWLRIGAGNRTLTGAVAGSPTLLTSVADKRRIHQETGALAADMESHALAAVAANAGLPFLVLRAISDPVTCDLPSVARIPLHPDGRVRIAAALRHLCANPREWPHVQRLGRDTRAGLHGLRRVVRAAALVLA
jgi:adenosylhomocysteine nucleosidase